MSNQKLKSDEFLKKLVKKMLLEQNYSPSDDFLENPKLAEPGNPDSDGMTPQQIDDVVWEKPPPELVSDSNFRAELRKYCGDKYVEGEFNIDAGEYYQKNPGEKCQWYSYLWNSGFPNQSKWPGAIDLNQYLEQARDMYNNPKKYISQIQGAEDDEDVKNWAIENWIYRREQFFNREYRRKQAEFGSNSGKPAWSELGKSAGSFMSYFYKLFTEDAQEFVRDQYRASEMDSFDNNHQFAVVSLNRKNTEGAGGTNLERVRSHMLLFNQYTYSNKKVFAEKLAKTYGKGVEKFVPASWDPNFYGINKDVLSYIVDFFEEKEPVLKGKLHRTQKRMPSGEVSTNLGEVQEAYMSLFRSFKFGLEMVLDKMVTQNVKSVFGRQKAALTSTSYKLGFEIFKDESYVRELIKNMSRVFHFGPGGWDGTNQTHGGFSGIQESITPVTDLDLNDRVLNRVLGLSEQNTWTGGRSFNIPSTSGTGTYKSPEQREREAEKRKYDKVSKPYGKEVDGRWNPLVLFLLTLRGLDFYSGKRTVGGQRKRVRGLSTREWLRNSQDGPFFSKNSETRKRAMVRFIGEYSRRVPSEFFNEYYINDVFIPSILDDTDLNKDSIPDKREFLVNWVAFQRAAVYDPTSEIAQNASRSWGAYGDQKITVDKTGKQKEIPKGYAYFYEWSNDTFNLFKKKQTLETISKYNTNMLTGLLYGTAEWMGAWWVAEKAFLAAETFIKSAAEKAALRATKYSRVPGVLRTISLGPAGLRHMSVMMRNGFTVGLFVAAFVILDYFGIWDISEDFKEKYEKIKDITCEFRDLINSLDTNDTKQFLAVKGSRAVLERIYENMIVAYSELIVLYTQTINKAGSQGISRRDLVLYERFKVIERLQYIQKYEIAIKKLFENCLEDVRAMKHDEEVTVLLRSLKDTGLDMDKACEILEKQIIQLATRADQCEDVDPDSMIKPPGCEYIPTGAPEELTGFPAAKDLLRVRDAYDKNKDEIGSIMSAIKSNTDLKPPLSLAFDGAMNLNRKPDPVGTWIMKGVNAVERIISPPEYFPEEDEKENNEGSMNESLSNNILLETNINKLNKTLTKYYGKDFDGEIGIAALQGLILDIQRPRESSVSKNNKDKTLAMAGADYRRYNSNVLKAADFEFRATKENERAMAIKTVIESLDKNFISQQGFKSKDFTNNSRFFGHKNESVFFSARFYNQFVKKPRGIDAVCPISYEFNENMGMCEVFGEARKQFFVSYSSDDMNYGFDEESLDFSGKEKFSTQGNILAGILEAAKRADSNTRSRIRPGGNLIDLDVVSEIYNQAVRKKGKLTATEAIIKKHIQLHVEDVDPKNAKLFNVRLPLLSTGCFYHAYSDSDEKGSVIGKLPFLSGEDMEVQIGALSEILKNFKTTVTPSQTTGNSGVVGVGPNPSGSTSNTASGSPNEERVKNLLRFHIMLMTFLKTYVKKYMMRDYGYNKKIKRYLNNDQANPAELKSALVEKLTVFIRTGEISELFDKRFQGKQKLNFSNIKSINIK